MTSDTFVLELSGIVTLREPVLGPDGRPHRAFFCRLWKFHADEDLGIGELSVRGPVFRHWNAVALGEPRRGPRPDSPDIADVLAFVPMSNVLGVAVAAEPPPADSSSFDLNAWERSARAVEVRP